MFPSAAWWVTCNQCNILGQVKQRGKMKERGNKSTMQPMTKRILVKAYQGTSLVYQYTIAMTLGATICKLAFFSQYKRHLLSTWHDFGKRNGADEFLFKPVVNFWMRFEYLKEKNPDKREKLKELAMGANSGREWAKTYDSRPLDLELSSQIGEMTFRDAVPIFNEMENILETIKTKLIVIQVGSSSGREIAYFANKYPTHRYIGTDIYQEVVDYSSHSHKGRNLSFRKLSAKNISQLLSELRNENMLIFSEGSLQYVQPEHLQLFFNSVAGYPSAMVLLNEPGNDRRVKPDELEGSMWRGNFSYTHNYKFYAEKAGIKTVKSRIIRPYIGKKASTVHYFYYGRTKGCKL